MYETSSECPVEATLGRVVIRKVEPPKVTAGGILLPDRYRPRGKKTKKEGEVACGVVVSIAPLRRLKDGREVACGVAVGEKVVYKTYTDTAAWQDGCGRTWQLVEQDDLLSVVEEVGAKGS